AEKSHSPAVRLPDVRWECEEPPQQLFQIARFQLNAEQLVERLGFGLAELIIGVIQGQNDAEVKLFADPLEVVVFLRQQRDQQRRKQPVVFLEGFKNRAGRQIQLGDTGSDILHPAYEIL